jgi:hypothetical protein
MGLNDFLEKYLQPCLERPLLTLTLQKSRMPQIQGVKGEAVVVYRKSLTTQEMGYPRLSRRVNNMADFSLFMNVTLCGFVNKAS